MRQTCRGERRVSRQVCDLVLHLVFGFVELNLPARGCVGVVVVGH
jgi:hypothetical protein